MKTKKKSHKSLVLKAWIASMIMGLTLVGCGKRERDGLSDMQEIGQQIGDLMAGVDESSGSNSGTYALASPFDHAKALARLEGSRSSAWDLMSSALRSAVAADCGQVNTFGSCSASHEIVRDFGGCTIGNAVLTGTVRLTWGGGASSCQMTASGHRVSRDPQFTLTGKYGATLTVKKTGTHGQVITRGSSAGSYAFSNDGIRRSLVLASGEPLFDFSTQTTSDISVLGSTRANRVLSGGTLQVKNHLSGVTCDFVPDAVTWASGCNCPVSGNWKGQCSDGKVIRLDMSGCGVGSLTVGGESQSFEFDRCYGV